MKLGFIGLGQITNALIAGILRNKLAEPEEIIGSCRTEETRKALKEQLGIQVTEHNHVVAKKADILFLGIPSAALDEVLDEIRPHVDNKKLVISLAPSGSLEWLDRELSGDGVVGFDLDGDQRRKADKLKIVRALPNTPAIVGAGMIVFAPNQNLTKDEVEVVTGLLGTCGQVQAIPEALFSVVGTLTGTAPAIALMMVEAMADAAATGGLSRDAAYSFAAQSLMGTASMLLATEMHPGQLRDMVCTPESGRTEAVRVLESTGFRSAVMESLKAVEQFQSISDAGMQK